MSHSNSIPLWQQIADQLTSAAAQPNELSFQHAQRIELLLQASPISTTTNLLDAGVVKKLVQAKVPLKVWQASCKLAKADTPHKTAIAVSATANLFRLLVGRDAWGAALSSKTNSNRRGLQQQFEQSDLLQQLPLLLTACAHKVHAATAAIHVAAAGVPDAPDTTGTDTLESSSSSSSSSSSLGCDARRQAPAAAQLPYQTPEGMALALLYTFADLCELQSLATFSTVDGVACLLPAMHLIVAVRQYLSKRSSVKQSSWQEPNSKMRGLLTMTSETSMYCVRTVGFLNSLESNTAAAQSLRQQVVPDVRFLEWLCTETAVTSVTELADGAASKLYQQPQQQQHPPQQQPQQGGSSTQNPLAGVLIAAMFATADQVPEPVCQLLQPVGISPEVALMAALLMRRTRRMCVVGMQPQSTLSRFHLLLQAYSETLAHQVTAMGGLPQQQQQQQQQQPKLNSPEQPKRHLQLRLLLAVALLHQAAAAPWKHGAAADAVQYVDTALFCSQACTAAHLTCMQAMLSGLSSDVLELRQRQRMGEMAFQKLCRAQAHQNMPPDIAQALQEYIAVLVPRVTQAQRLSWEAAAAAAATSGSTSTGGGSAAAAPSSSSNSSGGKSSSSSSSGSGNGGGARRGGDPEGAMRLALEEAVESAGTVTNWLAWHFQPAATAATAADFKTVATEAAAQRAQQATDSATAGNFCSLLEDLTRLRIHSSRRSISQEPATQRGQSQANSSSSSSSSSSGRLTYEDVLSAMENYGKDKLFLGQALNSLVTGDLLNGIASGTGLLDTPQVLQLFGLLCSLLKMFCPWAAAQGLFDPALARQGLCSLEFALGATGGMVGAVWVDYCGAKGSKYAARSSSGCSDDAGGSGSQSTAGGGSSGSGGATIAATLNAAGAAAAASGSISVVSVLPWLALLGRCCLHAMVRAADMSYVQQLSPIRVIGMIVSQVQLARDWLSTETVSQELSQIGYDIQAVVQTLGAVGEAVTAAGGDIEAASRASLAAAAAGQGADSLLPLLHTAGLALTGFASQYSCNNPWCSNVTGPSEAALVGGRSCMCAGCHAARYCTKACQKQHWNQHKPVCKALAAAAAAAAAKGG